MRRNYFKKKKSWFPSRPKRPIRCVELIPEIASHEEEINHYRYFPNNYGTFYSTAEFTSPFSQHDDILELSLNSELPNTSQTINSFRDNYNNGPWQELNHDGDGMQISRSVYPSDFTSKSRRMNLMGQIPVYTRDVSTSKDYYSMSLPATDNAKLEMFLIGDWDIEIPIKEETTRQLAEKYFCKCRSDKDSVCFDRNTVQFKIIHMHQSIVSLCLTSTSEKFIEVAKEGFFIKTVFGDDKVSAVADLLISRVGGRKRQWEGNLVLPMNDRLAALLLVHIIVCTEALNAVEHRSYSKAFSKDSFVKSFRDLLRRCENKEDRQKLYWMRLIWNSCLLEKTLSKIDSNGFWWKRNVEESPLPDHLHLRKKAIFNDEDEVTIVAEIEKRPKHEDVEYIVIH